MIKYSAHGSNDKKKEEATFGFFVDYLDHCEQGINMYSQLCLNDSPNKGHLSIQDTFSCLSVIH